MKNRMFLKAFQITKVLLISVIFLLSFISVEKINYSELYPAPYLRYILPSGEEISSTSLGTYLVRNKQIIYSEKIEYKFKSDSDPIRMRTGLDRFDDTQNVPIETRVIIKIQRIDEYLKPKPIVAVASLGYISKKRNEEILDQRLNVQLGKKEIQGEQWYRDSKGWLMVAFCNPVHYKCYNNELAILERYRNNIYPEISDYAQVYYGIGTGETELEIVRWQIESQRESFINTIDINSDFLDIFAGNLAAQQIEYPRKKITVNFICDIFQNLNRSRLILGDTNQGVHICVGSTIGNFRNQEEIFNVFKSNTLPGDKLLLGFQLNNHIKITLEKYRSHPYYFDFAINQIKKGTKVDRKKAQWNYEKKTGFITLRYGNIEVFRSKKYQVAELVRELSHYSFDYVDYWTDRYKNSSILLLKRV